MARKFLVVLGLAAAGFLAVPGAAQSYTPIDEPILDVIDDPADIVPDEPIAIQMENFFPGSAAVFTVAANGVDGASIGLSVQGSKSVDATVSGAGTFDVSVVFPTPATYTLTASGLDSDGNPTNVSTTLQVTAEGGLPGTGFSGQDALVGGLALIGAGITAVVLARRRTPAAPVKV